MSAVTLSIQGMEAEIGWIRCRHVILVDKIFAIRASQVELVGEVLRNRGCMG